ncbi:hypothetical protein [Streptomyces sp. NPDC059278]|uniref:hypothetical protein n=1 Tax=Streptomyces sp. NPDC059278 TaxID=3346801 RepID=UPI0036CEC81E
MTMNRPFNKGKVQQYADAMAAGEWQETPTFAFMTFETMDVVPLMRELERANEGQGWDIDVTAPGNGEVVVRCDSDLPLARLLLEICDRATYTRVVILPEGRPEDPETDEGEGQATAVTTRAVERDGPPDTEPDAYNAQPHDTREGRPVVWEVSILASEPGEYETLVSRMRLWGTRPGLRVEEAEETRSVRIISTDRPLLSDIASTAMGSRTFTFPRVTFSERPAHLDGEREG